MSETNNQILDLELEGGKKRRKTMKRKTMKRKSMKRKSMKKRKNKKGPSKWILHVKAFCKKHGKTFPEALKDPMCKKTFKH